MQRILVWIGGCALLGGTFVDSISVIGRHIGLPFRGAIEVMQMLVLVSGATAILVATLWQQHARVRMLVDRLSPVSRAFADRCSNFASAIFFFALVGGSVWLSADLWSGYEESELLGIPWRWMRVFANVCLALSGLIVLVRCFGPTPVNKQKDAE